MKKRHSLIKSDSIEKRFDELFNSFEKELVAIESNQNNVDDDDPLREKIEKFLHNKVGEPPNSQQIVDSIYCEGKNRYSKKIPPGFLEAL